MQRDRNMPNMDEETELEKDDFSLFIDIVEDQCNICAIYIGIVLFTFSLMFIYYHFALTCTIFKYSFYTWGIYNITKYVKYKFKKYIDSKKKYPILSPYGVPSFDSEDDENEEHDNKKND